ncbi:hypothetical protein VPHD479_0317 [Vibrio phage D479]
MTCASELRPTPPPRSNPKIVDAKEAHRISGMADDVGINKVIQTIMYSVHRAANQGRYNAEYSTRCLVEYKKVKEKLVEMGYHVEDNGEEPIKTGWIFKTQIGTKYNFIIKW